MAGVDNVVDPHVLPVDEVLAYYGVDPNNGLTEKQVAEMAAKYGSNQLDVKEGKSLWQLILAQFEDLLVRILLLSAVISFVLALGEGNSAEAGWTAYVEPLVILLILIANAFVGVWQESNAENALEALKKLQPETAQVLRDGRWQTIGAESVVPGDIVEVRVGGKVPADLRMIALKTTTIRLEQSQLTGEPHSAPKDSDPLSDANADIQSKTNMLFSSTSVSNGAAIGVAVRVGMHTEIGVIQSAVTDAAQEEEKTPLEKKIDDFGEVLAKVIFLICVLVWVINYKHFFDPVHGSWVRGCIYYFKIAVALAVAAIPEGLPAVITTCLALGTRKMAKRQAIVRKLPSVETLGCTSVICSDKTGTLTTNEMSVKQIGFPAVDGLIRLYEVEGVEFAPVGKVKGFEVDWENHKSLHSFQQCGALCNEARLVIDNEGKYGRTGEPTEAAILTLVEKLGSPNADTNMYHQQKKRPQDKSMAIVDYWKRGITKHAVLEFTRDRKSMSVLCSGTDNDRNVLHVKGAPESILARCSTMLMPDGSVVPLTEEWSNNIKNAVTTMARKALRTLAFARKTDLSGGLEDYNGPSHPAHSLLGDPNTFHKIETDLTFIGLAGLMDPPRRECKQAIAECRVAGISVIMITGDNKDTAEAIATDLNIINSNMGKTKNSFTGKEFDDLSDADKRAVLKRIMDERGVGGAVFSRTEPKHKQVIVRILKSLEEIVAMTGDGVNDAPALKQADIGIAMGITGTEVAKEASDMVLADDNFSTIVSAAEEGRSIYNNMKAFIRYLISSNIGEVASIFLTAALGVPEGLAPVQLLWVNLVTDGMPATALGFNPPDLDVMKRIPRNKNDNLISGWVFFRYMVIGMYVGFATVGVFIYWYVFDNTNPDGHTLVTLNQLMAWGTCQEWQGFKPNNMFGLDFSNNPCTYFTAGKVKASTLSLTVLVIIEMLNAFNAVSEDGSLLQMPPWTNPYLIIACISSVLVHFVIIYVPTLAGIFAICPLDWHDWVLVMKFAFPVILLDELLKIVARMDKARKPHKKD